MVQKLQVLHGKVKSRSLLGCDLEFLSEVSDLILVILGLLKLLFNLVCGLLRFIQLLDEAVRLKDFVSRVAECCENLVKDFTLSLRQLEGLLRVPLAILFLAG